MCFYFGLLWVLREPAVRVAFGGIISAGFSLKRRQFVNASQVIPLGLWGDSRVDVLEVVNPGGCFLKGIWDQWLAGLLFGFWLKIGQKVTLHQGGLDYNLFM